MHLGTSPTSIGLTPGHLSRGISREVTNASRVNMGCTNPAANCCQGPAEDVGGSLEGGAHVSPGIGV